MSDDIDVIPSVRTVPNAGELAVELERLLRLAYEAEWVRDALGDLPLAELRVQMTLSELIEGEEEPRLSDAHLSTPLSFPDGTCIWIGIDGCTPFPLYYDRGDGETMSTPELVDLIVGDLTDLRAPDPSAVAFPWSDAKEIEWHWSIWMRSSPRGEMRVLGKLGAIGLGNLVSGALSSGDHGLPTHLDPTTPTALMAYLHPQE